MIYYIIVDKYLNIILKKRDEINLKISLWRVGIVCEVLMLQNIQTWYIAL